MHDVFVVTSEGQGRGHIARIVYASDEVDARQAVLDSYPGEVVMDVVARFNQVTLINRIPGNSGQPSENTG